MLSVLQTSHPIAVCRCFSHDHGTANQGIAVARTTLAHTSITATNHLTDLIFIDKQAVIGYELFSLSHTD